MKKALFIFLLVLTAALLFSEAVESKYSYVTYPVYKVYRNNYGYIVFIRKEGVNFSKVYIPMEWFKPSGGYKASLQPLVKELSPTLTIIFSEGKFERVRLVVPQRLDNPVWGVLPGTFKDASSFNLDALNIVDNIKE